MKAQQMHTLAVEAAGEKAILVYYSKELESVTESQLIRLMQDMSIGKVAGSQRSSDLRYHILSKV